MAELDSLTPRSRQNGYSASSSTSRVAPPSFTVNLKDCEVNEGESFDLLCKTQGV